VFACLYYFGALFQKHDPSGNEPDRIFIAIFAMMLGAMAAG